MFCVGVWNELPQDVYQWFADYFELKAILALGSRETSATLFTYLEEPELGALLIHNKRLFEIISFDLSIWQDKLLFTKGLFLSCNDPLKSPKYTTSSLAQKVLGTPSSLSASESLGVPIYMYVLNSVIFSC